MESIFQYGEKEIDYLRSRDPRMAEVIDKIGVVRRRVIPDVFAALVHSIVGQQISTKAHESIWRKVEETVGEVSPKNILAISPELLQSVGISFRKVEYIRDAARRFESGEFDVLSFDSMSDEQVIEKLTQLERGGSLERGDAHAFFNATPGCAEFRRPGDIAWIENDISPPTDRPPIVREIPPSFLSVQQCGESVSLGSSRRRHRGDEGLRSKTETE